MVSAIAVPVAHAGQIVYPAGTGIWAMNEDGSNQHELVDVTQVSEMMALFDPDVQPNGNEVAFVGEWSQAPAEEQQIGSSPGACGGECLGYYELSGGVSKRISPAPFHCPQAGCASEEIDPRVADDGSVAFVSQAYVTVTGFGCPYSCGTEIRKGQSALLSRDANGANQQQWKTPCESEVEGSSNWVTDADVLSVDPAESNQLAYGNCRDMEQGSFFSYPVAFDVLLSKGRSAEYLTAASNPVSEPNEFNEGGCCEIQDLSYSSDGTQIVDARSNTLGVAGIYTYPAADNGQGYTGTEVLAVPEHWIFFSVRFIGGGRIAFAAGDDANKDGTVDSTDVYSIPASCTPATCTFPGSATNLTNTGKVNVDYLLGTAGIGYTSSTTPIQGISTGPDDKEAGTSKEKGSTKKESSNAGETKPVLHGLHVSPKAFAAARKGHHHSGGAVISYEDSEAAKTTLTVELKQSGIRHGKRCVAAPRRRPRHAKPCKRLSKMGSIVHSDSAGKNQIAFSGKVGGKALRPGSYLIVAVARSAGGSSKALLAPFTVKH
ncbi:MAG TPA: hypothetical protein VGF95_08905 [Solirubrobacteraceae bacterium]